MLDRIVIINSTPVIALASIDSLYLLKELYKKVYVPKAVYDEIYAKKSSKAQIEFERNREWIHVRQIENIESKKFFRVQLHDGEVEVMILGKELSADLLVIDDYIAREYAKYLDFKITGTLGVILKSKETSIIDTIKPYVDALIENGIYIGSKVYEDVLKLAGEL